LAGGVPYVGNYMVTPSYQRYDQASRDFINAILRRESGAAIKTSEFTNASTQYLPRPNDNPQVLADKRANREAASKRSAGRAGPKRGVGGGAGRAYPPSNLLKGGDGAPNPAAGPQQPVEPTRQIRPVRNEAEANKLIAYTRSAYKEKLIDRRTAIEDLRRAGV